MKFWQHSKENLRTGMVSACVELAQSLFCHFQKLPWKLGLNKTTMVSPDNPVWISQMLLSPIPLKWYFKIAWPMLYHSYLHIQTWCSLLRFPINASLSPTLPWPKRPCPSWSLSSHIYLFNDDFVKLFLCWSLFPALCPGPCSHGDFILLERLTANREQTYKYSDPLKHWSSNNSNHILLYLFVLWVFSSQWFYFSINLIDSTVVNCALKSVWSTYFNSFHLPKWKGQGDA